MIKIRYNNKDTFEEVSFSRNGNLITLTPTTPNTSGFTTYKLSGEQLGDFSDFNTVYKVDGELVTYSNDGSVYVEPIQPSEEELRRQSLINEKSELETWLSAHDYIGVKIATGRASISDYQEEISLMNIKANRINEINELLK